MICQEVMELMQRYIDDDLNQQETSLMMDHVGQCPDCAAMLVRLQQLSTELEQLPRVVPRYSLVDAILPELDRLASAQSDSVHTAETDTQPVPARLRTTRPGRNMFRKLSAVIAAGVVAGLLIVSQPQNWSLTGGSSNDEAAAPAPMAAELDNTTQLTTKISTQESAKSDEKLQEDKELQEDKDLAGGTGSKALDPDTSADSSAETPTETTDVIDQYGYEVNRKGESSEDSGSGEQESRGSMYTESPDAPVEGLLSPTVTFDKSVPAEASVSPDEKWRAISVANSGTIQVYKTADESEWYHSELREGQISLLSWNEDSTLLYYTHTDTEGKQTNYVLDVINVVESVR